MLAPGDFWLIWGGRGVSSMPEVDAEAVAVAVVVDMARSSAEN